jgi:hypothetical protein
MVYQDNFNLRTDNFKWDSCRVTITEAKICVHMTSKASNNKFDWDSLSIRIVG